MIVSVVLVCSTKFNRLIYNHYHVACPELNIATLTVLHNLSYRSDVRPLQPSCSKHQLHPESSSPWSSSSLYWDASMPV
uniref:Uncharacterized protein n=1 Tax=Arion vulgaris TaxID=1028688 RepID=A0A0B7BR45_9EUPU